MTRLSRKIAATRGQSRRVALLSQFFHHFLQLGWENDLCNFQMCLNLKHHWTIALDKESNLASWVFLVYPFTWSPVLHQFIIQILPRMFHRSFPHLWGNTIFNLALMCYSVWLGTASLYDIHENHGILLSNFFHMLVKYGPKPQAGDAEGPQGRRGSHWLSQGDPRVKWPSSRGEIHRNPWHCSRSWDQLEIRSMITFYPLLFPWMW